MGIKLIWNARLLGGLPLVQGVSPWSSALSAGSVTSPDAVRAVRTSTERLRTQTVPDAASRLQAVLSECGLQEPQNIEAWVGLFALLDGVVATLSVLDASVFTYPLDEVLADFAPAQSGGPVRALASVTKANYRKAKKAVLGLWRGGKVAPGQMYAAIVFARQQIDLWGRVASDGLPPRAPRDLAGSESAYWQLSAELRAVGAVAVLPRIGEQPFDTLIDQLGRMENDDDTLERLPELSRLQRSLAGAGLSEILVDVASRNLGAEQATSSLRYAWLMSCWTPCGRPTQRSPHSMAMCTG